MQRFLHLTFLILSASCGGKSDTGSAPETDDACASSFVLTQADGTEVPFGDCQLHGAEINFAMAPDAVMPQPHQLSFVFRTSTDTSVDCWVLWELEGICSERETHSFGAEGSTLTWNTTGCDMPDAAKGAFTATDGGSVFTTRTVVPEDGLEEGDPMAVNVQASVEGIDNSGISVTGTVVIEQTLPLQMIPYGGCQGANGDSDGDGFDGIEFGGDDCDDGDAQIHPGKEETCDGIDNNCDGQIDEGTTRTFYTDADGDGFGSPDLPFEACELPEGASEFDGDCDDSDPNRNPDEAEVCDGIDNDCDETADDGVQIPIYPDDDDDGFGPDEEIELVCPDDIPDGFTTEGGDCDDSAPNRNPDETEVCDDIDNDCDDEIDEGLSCD